MALSSGTVRRWRNSLSVRYLTALQVLYIHDLIIEATGGSHGLRDEDRLLFAIERPRSGTVDGEFFPAMFLKAAALMESIIRGHPFIDGNKRTGLAAAEMFLQLNRGLILVASQDEVIEFTVRIATERPETGEIATWLEQNRATP